MTGTRCFKTLLVVFLLTAAASVSTARAAARENPESDKSRRNSLTLIETLSKDETDKARVRIASVGVLLEHETNSAQLLKLRLNRAKVSIQIARVDRAQKNKAKADASLALASSDLKAVANIKDLNPEQISYINYLRGLVALDSGSYNEGIEFFKKALEGHPGADYAIGVSLYLGDEAYFSDKYDEASQHYSRYLKEMSAADHIRSEYRLAWIDLRRGNFKQAENEFLRLSGKKSAELPDLRKDVLRDLASLEVKFKTDREVLAFCRKNLKLNADEEIIFLRDAMVGLQHEGKEPSPVFLGRISALTKNAGDKIRLKLQSYQMEKSQRESSEDAFAQLIAEIQALPAKDKASVITQDGAELETETERAIEQMAQKFSAQAKAGAPRSQLQPLGSKLLKALAFLQETFRSKNKVKAMKIWLDVCATMKQWNCVLDRTSMIAGDKDYESIVEPALRERISALEELAKGDPEKYAPSLRQDLESYLEDSGRADWIAFAKRLSVLDIAERNFAAAQTVLAAVDGREKSEESYYRLQLNRFAQGLHAEIIQDERIQAPFASKRNADLIRESHLKLAQHDSGPGGDFAAYEVHLKEYLKQVKDPEKRSKLLKDYYERLEQNHDFDKLYAELTRLSSAERFARDLDSLTRRLINNKFSQGAYAEVQTLIGHGGSSADLKFTAVLARLANRESVPPEELNLLSAANKVYVLGLYALAATPRLEAYLHATPQAPSAIRNIGTLAAKIKSCDSTSAAAAIEPATDLEKKIAQVEFPKPGKLTKNATAKMVKTLERVRALRQLISSQGAKASPAVQLRLLSKGAALESKAAEAITTAPIPEGLNKNQAADYQGQVLEMAKEFSLQAEQFHSAADKVSSSLAAKAPKALPVRKLQDSALWPWPQTDVLKNLKQHDETAKLMTALIDLDFLRTTLKIADEDYWAMRAGFLLSKVPCISMVDYVYQELHANGQNKLIQQWSRL